MILELFWQSLGSLGTYPTNVLDCRILGLPLAQTRIRSATQRGTQHNPQQLPGHHRHMVQQFLNLILSVLTTFYSYFLLGLPFYQLVGIRSMSYEKTRPAFWPYHPWVPKLHPPQQRRIFYQVSSQNQPISRPVGGKTMVNLRKTGSR